ncbi:MAG: 2-oxo acid dehydrogenase subunit E2, partial [Gemmatimonadetes bacterium]|nr:2-oxo acid dehydrogenase subunit E2 [Gemmatimonadota bacterium]
PDPVPTPAAPTAPAPPAAAPGPAAGAGPATQEERLRTRSTPLVRKIAAEHGVDISQVTGTGTSGRVTRDDIMAFIESGAATAVAPAPPAAPEVPPAPEPAAPAAVENRAATAPAATPAVPAPTPAEPGSMRVPIHGATLDIKLPAVPIRENDRVEEMSRVRLRTMEHMLMSKRVSAHVTSVSEVDFEHVVRLRRKLKGKFAEQGVKLTYGPFVYRAVVEALREYPILNSSVDGARIVYHSNINLGVAVAVNDGTELIVPVIKDADRLSLVGLAQGANELAEKARSKSLDFDDIQGGTFTITNVGVFGNLFGTPIINQPQVAILGTGVIEKRPVVVQDDMRNDVIAIRHRAYFGLSYDHRVVDGAMAAFFLNKVQDYLENFPEESA